MSKLKDMLESMTSVWKTEAAFWSWVKGGIRKSLWNRHPVKIAFTRERRLKIPNPNPKGKAKEVWGGRCEICGNLFVEGQLQCDHRSEETAHLTKQEHLQECFEKLCIVVPDDLRWICKGCHGIHSYSQKSGLTFAQAKLEKDVIAFMKTPVPEQKKILTAAGYSDMIISNATKRRNAYREHLKGERDGNCAS